MEYAYSNCTYTESHKPEHTYTFTGILTIYTPGKEAVRQKHSVTVKGPDLFKYNRGAYIQDAFPYLSPKDREFLMTGSYFETNGNEELEV